MATNDFLTVEQVCEMLGKSAAEIETLVADGHLTPVWDGETAYYRRPEVEQVAAKEGSSIVDLAADVSGEEPGESFASALKDLADASSGLDILDASPAMEEAALAAPAELTLEEIPLDLPAAPKPDEEVGGLTAAKAASASLDPIMLDPGVPDLGLSGSSIISLDAGFEEPKADEKKLPAGGKKVGISVFDDEEIGIETDPMGETQIAASVPELESVGSGSGLLDLTRESDDTSLGPELLDVISPSAQAEETETETEAVLAEAAEDSSQGVEAAAAVETPYEAPMPSLAAARTSAAAAPGVVPLNVCALLGILALALVGLSTAAAIQGVWPSFLDLIAKDLYHYVAFGVLGLAAILTGVIGIMQGRK